MTQYGVLISNKDTGEDLAVLVLDPSGMLVASSLTKKIHPYSVMRFIDRVLDQPVYRKHADVLARDKVLSPQLMKAETECIADLISSQTITLGGIPIVAHSGQRG